MEGLIPLIYRAMVRQKTRQAYRGNQTGAGLTAAEINHQEVRFRDNKFFTRLIPEDSVHLQVKSANSSPAFDGKVARKNRHRRTFSCFSASADDFSHTNDVGIPRSTVPRSFSLNSSSI